MEKNKKNDFFHIKLVLIGIIAEYITLNGDFISLLIQNPEFIYEY